MRRGALLLLLVAGCAAGAGDRAERLGSAIEPIAGGQVDTGDPQVVAVRQGNQDLCSGVLLAQNAVLTARHCVAPALYTANDGSVLCGQTVFGQAAAPQALAVSAAADIHAPDASWRAVQQVLVPSSEDYCGNDVALVVLAAPVAEVTPLSPRLDAPISAGERYAAIGYGAIDDQGAEAGLRRRRDELSVACVGTACGSGVAAAEWEGAEAPCAGDSGGPALDEQGEVIGVVSRGLPQCSAPRYSSIAANGDWLRSATSQAAAWGSLAPPSWANPPVAPPAAPAPSSGCSAGRGEAGGGWLALALAITACRSSLARSRGRSPRRRCPRSSCRSNGR